MSFETDPTTWSVDARDQQLSTELLNRQHAEVRKVREIEQAVTRLTVADRGLMVANRERSAAEIALREITKDLPEEDRRHYRSHLDASNGFTVLPPENLKTDYTYEID